MVDSQSLIQAQGRVQPAPHLLPVLTTGGPAASRPARGHHRREATCECVNVRYCLSLNLSRAGCRSTGTVNISCRGIQVRNKRRWSGILLASRARHSLDRLAPTRRWRTPLLPSGGGRSEVMPADTPRVGELFRCWLGLGRAPARNPAPDSEKNLTHDVTLPYPNPMRRVGCPQIIHKGMRNLCAGARGASVTSHTHSARSSRIRCRCATGAELGAHPAGRRL